MASLVWHIWVSKHYIGIMCIELEYACMNPYKLKVAATWEIWVGEYGTPKEWFKCVWKWHVMVFGKQFSWSIILMEHYSENGSLFEKQYDVVFLSMNIEEKWYEVCRELLYELLYDIDFDWNEFDLDSNTVESDIVWNCILVIFIELYWICLHWSFWKLVGSLWKFTILEED